MVEMVDIEQLQGNSSKARVMFGGIDVEQLQESVGKAKASYGGTLALSIGMTAAAHPLTYVKVLIQVGHEPMSATETTTIFGKKVWRLPNFFQYIGHIRSVDGWLGLYRGLGPRIAQNIVNSAITNAINKKSQEVEDNGNVAGDGKSVYGFFKGDC